MNVKEAEKLIKETNIDDGETLVFFAAVIIFIGADYDWDLDQIHKATGYGYDDVATILRNWFDNGVLVDGKMVMESGEEELDNVIEITLIAMCGAGEVVKFNKKEEDMQLKFFNPSKNKFESPKTKNKMKKNLNEILFDQLERLSDATEDDIDLEVKKAQSILFIAGQILDVAKVKLQVIEANASDHFQEIGSSEPVLLESQVDDKGAALKLKSISPKKEEEQDEFFDADNFDKDIPDTDDN